jgi:hypothetical protein
MSRMKIARSSAIATDYGLIAHRDVTATESREVVDPA